MEACYGQRPDVVGCVAGRLRPPRGREPRGNSDRQVPGSGAGKVAHVLPEQGNKHQEMFSPADRDLTHKRVYHENKGYADHGEALVSHLGGNIPRGAS